MNSKQKLDQDSRLIVISYDLLARNEKFGIRADGQAYQVVVVDESHYIKDASTKRSKAVLRLSKAADRCILISGTPSLNRASELHTQLEAVLEHTPSFQKYVDRHENNVALGRMQGGSHTGCSKPASHKDIFVCAG